MPWLWGADITEIASAVAEQRPLGEGYSLIIDSLAGI